MNVIDLQNAMGRLTKAERDAVHAMLTALAQHFLHRRPAGLELREAIDRAIAAVTSKPDAATPDMLRCLSGIRRALFPDAAPYTPWLADSALERQPA